ncbi:hypothetical protein FMK52_28470 [Klebsiella pneumoniae]|nr:hypothetical protein KP13_32102 [Klebsiella pneumoniae subsp. pneumoniae Kp13]AXL27677.1 hypothetical protein AXK17_30595 [Klebsiella pneumoniae]MBZ7162589.1 hypothetical protein [Klebsiella pneumoniae]
MANSPGIGSSSTRWPSSDLDARRKSTRWPTYQAPAAARPGGQVQIWTPEGNQPGGQLTRHRQQLDQVAHFVRTKSGDAMRNLGGNPPRLRDFFNVERAFSCHSRPFWPIILIKKTGHPPRSIPENSDDPHS